MSARAQLQAGGTLEPIESLILILFLRSCLPYKKSASLAESVAWRTACGFASSISWVPRANCEILTSPARFSGCGSAFLAIDPEADFSLLVVLQAIDDQAWVFGVVDPDADFLFCYIDAGVEPAGWVGDGLDR